MALRPFSFPSPETRFFTADSLIYKFKIRGGNSFRQGRYSCYYIILASFRRFEGKSQPLNRRERNSGFCLFTQSQTDGITGWSFRAIKTKMKK
uniref:Uncharacterized protein n=1 Tax=Poecilia mexicana TaxID=48701 RepID=A0A3B3YFS5_9TELE